MQKTLYTFLAILCFCSCSKYLDEEMVTQISYDYYDTEAGVEDLVDGAYSELRYMFNGEQSFTLFNYGVDEYTQAADGQNKYFDDYTTQLNPSSAAYIHDFWTAYYRAINACNMGIQRIPGIEGPQFYFNETNKNQRIAELRFLRAFYYFALVQQFGAVPLTLTGDITVRLEFERAPVAEVYKSIISDLRFAESVLPPTQSQYGRITRGAARHYLAKVYLTRGSAVTGQRGQQVTDMDSAAYWANLVITDGPYQLLNDFSDLWNITNQENKEVILAAQFNNNAFMLNGSGNRTHLYYQMVYDGKPGMQRDIPYGRPWRRLMPTDYTLDIFDRKNDSRFYKSFRTVYLSNNASTIPKWTTDNAPSPALVGQPKFRLGDTAVFLTLHKNVTDVEISKKSYLWIPRNKFNKQDFLTLTKHLDPTRLDISTETGGRDGVYARLGETYLIAAEAYGRKGNYAKALEYINALRRRAAYKAGEAKPVHYWLTEGGVKGDVSSTESLILVTEAAFDANDQHELYPPSANSKEKRFIHFILNERTRELLGEFYRWMDLARTESLVERTKLYNPSAGAIQPYHKLRPIPQQHIDRLFRNGVPLTEAERAAEQNPGY
jgi:hypothetical protein